MFEKQALESSREGTIIKIREIILEDIREYGESAYSERGLKTLDKILNEIKAANLLIHMPAFGGENDGAS